MKPWIYPDFSNGIGNISATLAEFLHAPNQNPVLPVLQEALSRDYKNVVYLCFDGLGIYPMERGLGKNDLLRKHTVQILTSTFPSTTNAPRTLMTNRLPLEHGWFGWSLHFPKLKRNVDIFLRQDSLTRERVRPQDYPIDQGGYYFDQGQTDRSVYTVLPEYISVKNWKGNRTFRTLGEFWQVLEDVCREPGPGFVYGYCPGPDGTMHQQGVSSPQAREVMGEISRGIQNFLKTVKDTLLIVSADHGQVDIAGYVDLYGDEKLMGMLKTYPFQEARAPAFLVKPQCRRDFQLFPSEHLIEQGVFGERGSMGYLLGDYIALGTYTHKIALLTPHSKRFKGHHTSMTEKMEVYAFCYEKRIYINDAWVFKCFNYLLMRR